MLSAIPPCTMIAAFRIGCGVRAHPTCYIEAQHGAYRILKGPLLNVKASGDRSLR
jgi:hypothetical protein